MKLYNKIMNMILIGLLASCSFLEIEPETAITAGRFWKTAADVDAAAIAMYDGLQNFTYSRDIVFVSGIRSDELVVRSGGNNNAWATYSVPPTMNPPGEFWRESYFTIHRVNDVLLNVPRVEDPFANKNRALGEAHFLRGLLYFNLVRNFGAVPLVTETTSSINPGLYPSRNTVEEVYTFIINDLLEAESLLNGSNPISKSYASVGAARALLARVYLHRQATGDIQLALEKTEQVMNDSYSLVSRDQYASLFSVGAQNTSETIFEISFRPSIILEGSSNAYREMVSSDFNNPRSMASPKIIEALNADPNDVRATMLGTHRNITYTKKYEPAAPDQPRVQDVNIIVIRLADVILMRAECLARLNRTAEAIPFLNQVRTRAGLEPTTALSQDEVIQAIMDERYLELAFEGHRYYDLVRTGKLLETVDRAIADKILWPIPQRDIDQNVNLVQNPGYVE